MSVCIQLYWSSLCSHAIPASIGLKVPPGRVYPLSSFGNRRFCPDLLQPNFAGSRGERALWSHSATITLHMFASDSDSTISYSTLNTTNYSIINRTGITSSMVSSTKSYISSQSYIHSYIIRKQKAKTRARALSAQEKPAKHHLCISHNTGRGRGERRGESEGEGEGKRGQGEERDQKIQPQLRRLARARATRLSWLAGCARPSRRSRPSRARR